MRCGTIREALSARLDGEDPGLPDDDIDAHLGGCESVGCLGPGRRVLLVGVVERAPRDQVPLDPALLASLTATGGRGGDRPAAHPGVAGPAGAHHRGPGDRGLAGGAAPRRARVGRPGPRADGVGHRSRRRVPGGGAAPGAGVGDAAARRRARGLHGGGVDARRRRRATPCSAARSCTCSSWPASACCGCSPAACPAPSIVVRRWRDPPPPGARWPSRARRPLGAAARPRPGRRPRRAGPRPSRAASRAARHGSRRGRPALHRVGVDDREHDRGARRHGRAGRGR